MSTLWLKTLRDLWLFKARTLLVVVAIAVGTAAAGVAVTSLIVLRRDLREGYQATNPAHAILDTSPFDPALAARVVGLPGVAAAEARRVDAARLMLPLCDDPVLSVRRTFLGALHVGGDKKVQRTSESAMHQACDGAEESRALVLWTLPDAPPAVGRLTPQDGAPLPPPPGTILLERSVRSALPLDVGDEVLVRLSDGDTFRLTVAGFVHDMAVPPTTVQPGVFGYIGDATAGRLGLPAAANQVYVRLGARGPWNLEPSRAEVETTVTDVTEWLKDEGIAVGRAGIPEPGVHLMQGNVDTGLLMIGILGGLTLLLGAFLVANVVGAVIAQQTRQIGVLKALGGGRGLVLRLYGRLVVIFGGLALLVAVPLGLVGAWFMSSTLAAQLNYDIPSFGLTAGTLLAQAAGALLVPLLAALPPLRSAARLSVRAALAGEGPVAERGGRASRKERQGRQEDASSLRPWRSWRSLREVLLHSSLVTRRSSLISVALRNVARRPGRLALTVAALALAGALFMATFGLRQGLYEAVEILVGEFPSDVIIDLEQPQAAGRLQRAVDGLDDQGVRVELWGVADARRLYGDGRSGSSFTLYGVPPTTRIAPSAERDGQWLDSRFQVPGAREQRSSLEPGPWNLEPSAVANELTARLEAAGIPVARTETAEGQRASYRAQFDTLVVLLMALAGLTALVGGLGLGNTMALNVLERSREIGVLRAMGARRPLLRRLVLAEGLLIALGSVALAVPLAVPLTLALDRIMGNTLLGSPLTFAFSAGAALGWLGLVVVIGVVACWLPAERAARMTVREAVAYE